MTVAGRAKVATEAQEQLLSAATRQDTSGFLVGFRSGDDVVVLSCCTFNAEEATIGLADWGRELSSLFAAIPCGLSAVGVFCTAGLEPKLSTAVASLRKQLKTDAALVAACVDDAVTGVKWMIEDAALDDTITAPAKELLAEMMTVRLTSKVRLTSTDTAQAITKLTAAKSAFCMMQGDAVSEVVSLPKDADMKFSELTSATPTAPEASAPSGKKGGKKSGSAEQPQEKASGSVVQLRQMWSSSCDQQPAAPVLSFQPTGASITLQTTTMDVLGLFAGETTMSVVLAALREGAVRQAEVLSGLLKAQPSSRPTALHFSVTPHQPFPVTVCYAVPAGELDAAEAPLLEARKHCHRRLLLPVDRPFLRIPQALSFSATQLAGVQRLQNVHEGLHPSGLKGGSVHLVQGRYEYCHYMQDKFNDDGWGCMYRSYQTVLSWFRLQHYTSQPIQSHEDIQRMLVKMGDKPDRFIGSKQWIGAMEASMLLDQYLSVQSKVMNVASGHDLEDKGRELAHHFDSQGTPIPIGGGVLAFTILGVHFNPETGQVKFLILDPHYTGGEDLGTIQNQGKKNACSSIPSVGWHDVSVFRKDSFYNLCLPQRPTAI